MQPCRQYSEDTQKFILMFVKIPPLKNPIWSTKNCFVKEKLFCARKIVLCGAAKQHYTLFVFYDILCFVLVSLIVSNRLYSFFTLVDENKKSFKFLTLSDTINPMTVGFKAVLMHPAVIASPLIKLAYPENMSMGSTLLK